ncbi:MAG TPA: catalase, partial [Pseudoxanthomonas sp.]|nr:catalase [Pseudoxanthomonas sp.]
MASKKKKAEGKPATSAESAAKNTDSGPAQADYGDADTPAAKKQSDSERGAAAMRFNLNKQAEHGAERAQMPPEGTHMMPSREAGASTLTEGNVSAKTGEPPEAGADPTTRPLDRVRVDPSDRRLTTNQGVPIADNQNSLKAGLRGPALLKDFILREKITHFDHERIPERIVHARGSGAHGFFEAYEDLSDITAAAPFQHAGKQTPV